MKEQETLSKVSYFFSILNSIPSKWPYQNYSININYT